MGIMHSYDVGNARLLEREDEQRLAREIREGFEAQACLEAEADDLPNEELMQLRRAVRKGARARTQFIEANTRLVRTIARRLKPIGCDEADLIQAGMTGLIRAVEKFDERKGFKFSTYAVDWIRQGANRELDQNRSLIRVASQAQQKMRSMATITATLVQQLGREPTSDELADCAGCELEEIHRMKSWGEPTLSLDQPWMNRDEVESGTLLDSVRDPNAEDAFDAADSTDLSAVVRKVTSMLTSEEREVLFARHMSEEQMPPMTKRTRHVLERAKSKLRHPASDVPLVAATYL